MQTLVMVIKSSSMNLESGQKSLPPPQGHFEPAAEHRGLHVRVKYVGCAPWGCDLFGGARGSRVMVRTEHRLSENYYEGEHQPQDTGASRDGGLCTMGDG